VTVLANLSTNAVGVADALPAKTTPDDSAATAHAASPTAALDRRWDMPFCDSIDMNCSST